MKYRISLSSVVVPKEAYGLMEKALREGKIGQSEYIVEFEEMVADYVGAKYCIAVCNGTMADAVAIAAAKSHYHIKQVIVPALTFVAQPNSVLMNGLPIVFTDVKEDWTMDLKGALVPLGSLIFYTDIMGRIGDIDDARSKGTTVEDACEAFGSTRNGWFAGTFGAMGTYSFFPSHTISTGEGGAIVTNNDRLAMLCQSIRAHGAMGQFPADRFRFPRFGFNAKMSTLQAVLGIALMKHVDELVGKRREVFEMMVKHIGGFKEQPGERTIAHGYPLFFENEKFRDEAFAFFIKNMVECRKFFSCLPTDEEPHRSYGFFPVARKIADTSMYIPCTQNMSKDDVLFLSNLVKNLKGRI